MALYPTSEPTSRWEWIGFAVTGGLGVALFVALSALVARAARRDGGVKAAVTITTRREAGKKAIAARLARLPMVFEKNVGQFDPPVKFVAQGAGYALWLTEGGAELEVRSHKSSGPWVVVRGQKGSRQLPTTTGAGQDTRLEPAVTAVVRLRLVGANRAATVEGEKELPGKANYFIGNNPKKWCRDVPTYARVEYRDVYPGIDLVYHGRQEQLEYDFRVAVGASVKQIRMAVKGGRLRLAADGDLVVETVAGGARFRKPVVYQEGAGRKYVAGRFVLLGKHAVGFRVGRYDPLRPLVIDPVLVYSTYLGGSAFDDATGIAVDSSGNVYVTGYTTSTDFPVVSAVDGAYGGGACNTDMSAAPCFDAFVAKLNPQGTGLVYSTYLGGSGDDRGTHIAVDSSGDAYVVGYTNSSNFPTANALQPSLGGGTCGSTTNPYPCYDAFITELGPSGSNLVYSTYLGGQGDDYGMGIAVDSSGSAYVTGFTSGSNFPITSGAYEPSFGGGPYDAFVAKISPGGTSLVYSTFLGGSGEDRASAIAVDSSGDAYVTGQTNSTNFPTANPFQAAYAGGSCGCFDAFIAKLNPTGSALVYSTYLGGTGGDYGDAIAVDASDEAFIAGWTTSTDFPVTSDAYQKTYGGSYDAFVTKLSAAGNSLVYSTYLGGIDPEVANGIALDSSGDAYITGNAYGVGFPAVDPLQVADAGFYDAFIAAFNPSGSGLLYATWLGGTGDDFGNDIAVDSSGNAYVAGETFSTNFPTTPGAYQTAYAGGAYDGFIAKIGPENAPGVAATPNPVSFGDQEVGVTGLAQNVQVMDAGSQSLDISGISTSGDFAATNNCPSTLSAGTSCNISVTFTATSVGTRTGTLTLSDNAASSPQTLSLTGIGTSGAVTLSTTSLDFGSVEAGSTSAAQSVTLTNTGGTPLYLTSVQAEGTYSETDNCPGTVAPESSCTISVTFQPTSAGASVGQVVITDSAPASPQTIELSGTGTAPEAALAPTSLSFDTQGVGTSSAAQTVTLSNTGTASLSITSVSVSSDFSQTNNCGSSLAAGANCAIQVIFSPTAAGSLSGTLMVADNAAGSPQSVTLSGTGTAPAVSLAPASLSFGNQGVGTTSAPETVTLTNAGNAALAITSIAASGDFAETNNCDSNLAAGANCAIQVTFSPTATGTRSGTLTISDNAGGSPQSVALTGSGVAAFALTANAASTTVTAGASQATFQLSASSAFGFNGSINLACADAAPASCSFNPTSLTVGGSSTLTIGNLTEVGGGSFSFNVVGTSGSQSVSLPLSIRFADFSLSSPSNSATIAAGGTANYSLTVTPLNGFTGGVNFTCAGAPSAATCGLNPASVKLDGTDAVSVAVSVATTAMNPPRKGPRPPVLPLASEKGFKALWVLFWMALLVTVGRRARSRRRLGLGKSVVLTTVLAVMLASCGGGGGGTPPDPPADPPTPPGTYTLSIQANSGSLSHQINLTLVVN